MTIKGMKYSVLYMKAIKALQEAMERTKINFVDICSGVELSPGKKDVKKLESVVRLVKHG